MSLELTRRPVLAGLLALATATPGFAQEAEKAPREVLEMAIGDENAPVTVIEYLSFTCPHCMRFHTEVFPKIKENYIDTGKVRFIVREVYFDKYGLWAGMVARCAGPDRYFGVADVLFHKQGDWAHAETEGEIVEKLYGIGRQAGLTDDELDSCLQDSAFAEALVARYQETATADEVSGTPSFIVNGTKQKNMPYEDFVEVLDAELAS
jgi:protein-disulfide isomerase